MNERRLELFPPTTRLEKMPTGADHLSIGGCDLTTLAEQYGTPLYIYDQATLDGAVDEYRAALRHTYPHATGITYAGKAFLCVAIAQWAARRGLWVDCTGAGEIHIAVTAGVPRAQILVHGVNKSVAVLAAAVTHAGTIVVDNLIELHRLAPLRKREADFPDLWLRVRPGVAVETHSYRQTGQDDSKFGMSSAEAMEAVLFCCQQDLPLAGVHFHQGSHFHDPEPIGPGVDRVLDLIATLRQGSGWTPAYLSPGGGWGIPYHEDDLPHPSIADYVRFVAARVEEGCEARDLPLPILHMEPGRSLVARAGVAIYRVGALKRTPHRRWLLLDGGMADNIRPALYGARYSALPVVSPLRPVTDQAWLAGPYCESGDVLISALPMPDVQPGEMIAIPASGAYHLMMGSNYNGALRPAVLWVSKGQAQLIQRRETLEDLVDRDLALQESVAV
ncbi:MAG: diaminopimelate decarboxylase [Caldilineaceae bacterium]|nr:diaminopimelate decarboxylase [Caldilineaceae bacterium]